MNLITAKLILVGCGVWIAQDSIASIWFYFGKEKWSNQAFRVARLVVGVLIILIAVSMVD